jgi:hypothetical protein
MKQQLILWICSVILTFITGYIKNVTDTNYPVTGTFGIDGQKVSYKLDKVHYGEEPYKLIILTELKELKGRCVWRLNGENVIVPLSRGENNYYAEIPSQKPLDKIDYSIIIYQDDKVYNIPRESMIKMTFYGKIPASLSLFHFILLYSGIIFAFRTTIEIFNEKKLIKKYSVITTSIFILLTAIINPLLNSYKLGAINNFIPAITEIIETLLIVLLLVWIVGSVMIFYNRFVVVTAATLLLSTLLIYFNLPLV